MPRRKRDRLEATRVENSSSSSSSMLSGTYLPPTTREEPVHSHFANKHRYETGRLRMDPEKDAPTRLQSPPKADVCNGFPSSPVCQQCGACNKRDDNNGGGDNSGGGGIYHPSADVDVKTKDAEHLDKVFTKFDYEKDSPVSREEMEKLKSFAFNNWDVDEADMLLYLRCMFQELSLLQEFNIEMSTLQKWLKKIYLRYNDVPFHNFKHCFCVAQMTFALVHLMELQAKIPRLDIFVLIFSAICHDLDHPGFSNNFQVNSGSTLSMVYNDSSPLENHHCSTAFRLVLDEPVNILKNLEAKDFALFRKGVIKCILATDMAKHHEIMSEFATALDNFEYTNVQHRNLLMMVIIKVADISNEMRSIECSTRWMDCLFTEYFHQSDVEKERGLPLTPFMDRNKIDRSESQVTFIRTFLLPSLKSLARLDNRATVAIAAVESNLTYYQEQASKTKKAN